MFSAEDFPASHTATQVSDSVKRTIATSGRKCLEQFERFPRAGSWAKMFAALLIGTEDWFSTRSSLTWKLKATKCSRFYFQLAPSMLPTVETGFGLWPTPNTVQRGRPEIAQQMKDQGLPLYTRRDKEGNNRQFSILDFAIYNGMLPTPMAAEGFKMTGKESQTTLTKLIRQGMLPTPTTQDAGKATKKMRDEHQNNLTAVVFNMLPTPTATDYKGGGNRATEKRQKDKLSNFMHADHGTTGKTSHLNPRFVAEMMGFPANWTELPFQSGETSQ